MREEWDDKAKELEAGTPNLGRFPIAGLVRRARRIADLSQRELAARTGLAQSTVGRVETGTLVPSLAVLQRLLAGAGLTLVVVDHEGHVIQPMREAEWTRDGGGRRYPSHLDTILDPQWGEWWGDGYGLARPPETFVRNRARRDYLRARSVWEVRAKQYRHVPPPQDPDEAKRAEQRRQNRPRPRWSRAPFPPEDLDDIG